LERFAEDLRAHGGDPGQITEMAMDMSVTFISGAAKPFSHAEITFDKFHVLQAVAAALDEVRRQKGRYPPELRGARYLWLRNDRTLKAEQRQALALLQRLHLKTARAHALRQALSWFCDAPADIVEDYLRWWYNRALRSGLQPMVDAGGLVKRHRSGILHDIHSRATNAVLQGSTA